MRIAASWNGYLNKARFGGVNQGLIYVLIGVVVVVLLALPMVHKMGNNGEGEGTPGPSNESNTHSEENTQIQSWNDPGNPAAWRTDYQDLLTHAKSTGQLLAIYMYSEESEKCKIVEKEVFGNKEFQDIIKNCVKVKVHVNEQGIIDKKEGAAAGDLVIFKSPRFYVLGTSYNRPADLTDIVFSLGVIIPPELR